MTAWTCPCCGSAGTRPDPKAVVDAIKMSPTQRRIADLLASRFGRPVLCEHVADVVYADDPDGGPDGGIRVISAHISKIRRRIAKHGLSIDCGRGPGEHSYRMTWSDA